ncbi:NAD-dependent protein deacylase sirtuin-6-like isoform X2 [Dysidea avara]|uniref:NAD-dependent protein deacylase sirtuin-6-like isoform X2 n=1 Tax=Dysidea avara TaxID=196820 RepID=UPI0033278D4F
MSCDYAAKLSDYRNKGICGVAEQFDTLDKVHEKLDVLCSMIREAKHIVVHTGAGISTSAGIPDFRGPNGVWTLEKQGRKRETNVTFESAQPSITHMALVAMVRAKLVHLIVSQNVDGLHLKSGLPREYLSELHGNVFMERCEKCGNLLHPLRGKLRDTVLDWKDCLPKEDLEKADHHSSKADLSICLGTTLQIVPSGTLPLLTRRNKGKLVICNLQPTKYDDQADLLIHSYVDNIMEGVMKRLGMEIPEAPAVLDRKITVSQDQ